MKVTKTKSTSGTTSSIIDFEAKNLDESVKREVGDFLVEKILEAVRETKSPVSGGAYKKTLSKKYKLEKQDQGLPGKPNLELSGSMLDSLDYRITAKGIEMGIFGDDAPKADGHNNFSGKSKIPRRQFLPEKGQRFLSDIQSTAEQIINEARISNNPLTKSDVEDIETKADFWDMLRSKYDTLTRSEIIDAVLLDQSTVDLLKSFNLLKFMRG